MNRKKSYLILNSSKDVLAVTSNAKIAYNILKNEIRVPDSAMPKIDRFYLLLRRSSHVYINCPGKVYLVKKLITNTLHIPKKSNVKFTPKSSPTQTQILPVSSP